MKKKSKPRKSGERCFCYARFFCCIRRRVSNSRNDPNDNRTRTADDYTIFSVRLNSCFELFSIIQYAHSEMLIDMKTHSIPEHEV